MLELLPLPPLLLVDEVLVLGDELFGLHAHQVFLFATVVDFRWRAAVVFVGHFFLDEVGVHPRGASSGACGFAFLVVLALAEVAQ
jgi:hypothetical protein